MLKSTALTDNSDYKVPEAAATARSSCCHCACCQGTETRQGCAVFLTRFMFLSSQSFCHPASHVKTMSQAARAHRDKSQDVQTRTEGRRHRKTVRQQENTSNSYPACACLERFCNCAVASASIRGTCSVQ